MRTSQAGKPVKVTASRFFVFIDQRQILVANVGAFPRGGTRGCPLLVFRRRTKVTTGSIGRRYEITLTRSDPSWNLLRPTCPTTLFVTFPSTHVLKVQSGARRSQVVRMLGHCTCHEHAVETVLESVRCSHPRGKITYLVALQSLAKRVT